MADRPPSLIGRVPAWAARRPAWVVGGVVLITALALWVVPGLKLQTGIYELFPRGEGAIRALATYGRIFGARQEVVVLVSGADPGSVARGTRLAAAELSRSKAIAEVSSGVQGTALTASLGRSLLLLAGPEAWPAMRGRLTTMKPHVARLRRMLLSPVTPNREVLTSDPLGLSELLLMSGGAGAEVDRDSGLFAAPGGKAALIIARPVRAASDLAFCRELDRELQGVQRRVTHATGGEVKLAFTGGYHYALHIAAALKQDLTLSSFVALGGVVLFMLLFFRSLRLVPLAVLVSGVAVLWTLALAALTVGGLNALSMAFAALCVGMGLDGLIHVTARTRSFAAAPSPTVAALGALAPALLAASLTTVAAFLTFTVSAFDGLSHTGLLAACGLGLTLLLTLLLVPALGSLSSWLSVPVQRSPGRSWLDGLLGRLAGVVVRGRWIVVLVTLTAGGLALSAAPGLRFSAELTDLAPASIPPAKTDREIARHFARGRYGMIVMLRGAEQRALGLNDRLARLLRRWRGEGRVASFRSIAGLLPSRQTQRQRRARLAALNPSALAARLVRELEAAGLDAGAFKPFTLALTDPRELSPAELPDALKPLIQRHLARAQGASVVATVVHPPPEATAADQRRLASDLRRAVAPLDRAVAVEVTGAAVAGYQMAELLRRDLLLVSLLSLGLVLVVLIALLRRLRAVAAAVLSLALTGLAFVGALRALELQIDLYSLMVLPLLIGYGVDDHIYVVRRALSDGVRTAVVESGRAVLATTLTSMAAFGALALCQVPGLRTLGLTAILGLALGLLGSLVVMPALLSLGRKAR
jgi:uncharacterized protein